MYGEHKIPFKFEQEGLRLSVAKEEGRILYRRECLDQTSEKILLLKSGRLLLNPVEPLLTPKELTPYLMIAFSHSLNMAPKTIETVFISFPIEIGVYLLTDGEPHAVDAFSLVPPKFSLYGDPRNGTLCKYWKSEVWAAPPETDSLKQGLMELKVVNPTPGWVEIKRAIFNAYGMKIYYTAQLVAMKAEMRIRSGETAETEFENAPFKKGMLRSREMYVSHKLSMQSSKFVMEAGL